MKARRISLLAPLPARMRLSELRNLHLQRYGQHLFEKQAAKRQPARVAMKEAA